MAKMGGYFRVHDYSQATHRRHVRRILRFLQVRNPKPGNAKRNPFKGCMGAKWRFKVIHGVQKTGQNLVRCTKLEEVVDGWLRLVFLG